MLISPSAIGALKVYPVKDFPLREYCEKSFLFKITIGIDL